MSNGIIIVHRNDLSYRYRSYAYADHSIPKLEGWHSEAYVCGDLPPRYPVPAISSYVCWCYARWYSNADGFWNEGPQGRVI